MNTLYTYHQAAINESNFTCLLRIDPEHDIFKGHFPSKALLPGVCMIQMMIESISDQMGRNFELKSASMIKFINMWLPESHHEANMQMTFELKGERELYVKNCVISADDRPIFKFKGRLYAA